MRIIGLLFAVIAAAPVMAQDRNAAREREILASLEKLAAAALANDVSAAEKLFDEKLIVTSQSGKVYSKAEAIADLKNPFDDYRNGDVRFVHLSRKAIVASYENSRKRRTLEAAKFRVTAVFAKSGGAWRIVSLHSTRIAAQGM
jgi:ketosteroid isomerase-like protein